MLFFYLPASCQTTRWVLSFNPFGLLEPKAVVGIGVGYNFSRYCELWSETSAIRHVPWGPYGANGIRQILRFNYFIRGLPYNFVALEVRYKGYQYTRQTELQDIATRQDVSAIQVTEHRGFLGEAFLFGFRKPIDTHIGLYMETTLGLGIRQMLYDKEKGVPHGFRPTKEDNVTNQIETASFYCPFAIRLIWMFGKKLQP